MPPFIMDQQQYNQRVLTATGQPEIDAAIHKFDGFTVVGGVDYKREVLKQAQELNPDILLVGEGLSGQESVIQLILDLSKTCPNVRIIYLSGFVDKKDEAKASALGLLVMSGIYDIVHDDTLTFNSLYHLFLNPKTAEDMAYLAKRVTEKQNKIVEFIIPEEMEDEDENVQKNMHIISSIKPGTGKSFLSSNVATAIATYGVEVNGKKPRVALIEADLQNLSIGTLLQIEDEKKHLKAVIDKISGVVNETGTLIGNLEQVEDTDAFIRECFHPYSQAKNLEALVGSHLSYNQLEKVKPYHYAYLIEAISKHYDVIIVDTNSSLSHVTTYPLLQMAKSAYYILNLDFNNIRNNNRYKEVLRDINVLDKVRYVLNEDYVPEENSDHEPLIFTADHIDDSDFKLEARIPQLPKSIFLNRLYEGTPVVLDEQSATLKARFEILKVANQIWPIKNLDKIEEEVEKSKRKKKKGLFY